MAQGATPWSGVTGEAGSKEAASRGVPAMCFMLHGTGTHMFKTKLTGKRLTYFTGEEPDIHTGERVPKFTAQLSHAIGTQGQSSCLTPLSSGLVACS